MIKLVLVTILFGCAKPPLQTSQTDNNEFQVSHLFTHDGCKVYRFFDNGRYRYFTNCTSTISDIRDGKFTREEEIPNSQRKSL